MNLHEIFYRMSAGISCRICGCDCWRRRLDFIAGLYVRRGSGTQCNCNE